MKKTTKSDTQSLDFTEYIFIYWYCKDGLIWDDVNITICAELQLSSLLQSSSVK